MNERAESERHPLPNRLPGRAAAVVVVALFGAFVLIDVGRVANHFAGYPLHRFVFVGDKPHELPLGLTLSVAVGLARLALIVAFLVWIHVAARNCRLLGTPDPDYEPGWAVAAFLIPFYNLVGPYLVMQEIWRASKPRRPRAAPEAWRERNASVVITVWWAFCLLSLLPIFLETQLVENARDPQLSASARWTDNAIVLLSNGWSMLAAAFGALAVVLIRRRQLRRFRQIGGEAAPAEWPWEAAPPPEAPAQEAPRPDTTTGGDFTTPGEGGR
jgi:hypothetical protein